MKTIFFLIAITISLSGYSQFKYNDGKATANMDTLGSRNDTLFLRNRITGDTAYLVIKDKGTIAYTTDFNASNGLTKDGDTIKLGGEFTGDIDLYGSNKYLNVFADNGGAITSELNVEQGNFFLSASGGMNSFIAKVKPSGLYYSEFDSTTFTDSTLVPKRWVLDRIGSGANTTDTIFNIFATTLSNSGDADTLATYTIPSDGNYTIFTTCSINLSGAICSGSDLTLYINSSDNPSTPIPNKSITIGTGTISSESYRGTSFYSTRRNFSTGNIIYLRSELSGVSSGNVNLDYTLRITKN